MIENNSVTAALEVLERQFKMLQSELECARGDLNQALQMRDSALIRLAKKDALLENALDVIKNVDDLDQVGEDVKADIEQSLNDSEESKLFDYEAERVHYEAMFAEKAKTLHFLHKATTLRYVGGQYINSYALFGWIVWNARATLEKSYEYC